MTYFCYIQSLNNSVPYMEPLEADNAVEAENQAKRLLGRHDRAYAAHVFQGAELLVTVNGQLPAPRAGAHP